MNYKPADNRYQKMAYRRCGNSGIHLPLISLGLWQNFGQADPLDNCRSMILTAFDNGITHFDLANNYGPPAGAAEETFKKIYLNDLRIYRDELFISTKAGWKMWDGPYGNLGSKKHLCASIDQSLKRLGLEYVDIFYHHRPDPDTSIEETMNALSLIVQQGKALYIGISGYPPETAQKAFEILRENKTPCLLHQPKYSLLNREIENGLLSVLEKNHVGCITFSGLAQGILTNKYLNGIPGDSRVAKHPGNGAITGEAITADIINKVQKLNKVALQRDQSLAQMAIAWIVKDPRISSVILGASQPRHITEALTAINNYFFSKEELETIDAILSGEHSPI